MTLLATSAVGGIVRTAAAARSFIPPDFRLTGMSALAILAPTTCSKPMLPRYAPTSPARHSTFTRRRSIPESRPTTRPMVVMGAVVPEAPWYLRIAARVQQASL